jgi:hypothetical protein
LTYGVFLVQNVSTFNISFGLFSPFPNQRKHTAEFVNSKYKNPGELARLLFDLRILKEFLSETAIAKTLEYHQQHIWRKRRFVFICEKSYVNTLNM